MVCTYCGLATDGGTNHGSTESCIRALIEETRRLKSGVRQLRESSSHDGSGGGAPDGESGQTVPPTVRVAVTPDVECA